MKKDKEWLKNSIITEKYYTEGRELKAKDSYEEGLAKGTRKGLQISLDLIDQLEEPEQEKVVVPQFVGDYIEIAKQDINLIRVFDIANNYGELDKWKKEYGWIRGHYEVFARAWLDGYTVEKEKLYRVILPSGHVMYRYNDNGDLSYAPEKFHKIIDGHCFTEQEIKNLDERYWVFAEEVTE